MTPSTNPGGAGDVNAVGDPVDPALTLLLADRAALAATLDRFAGAFTALSGLLLGAPDQAVLERVREEELLGEWPWQDDDPESRYGVALLRESALAGEDEDAVRRDYARLFFGPGPMIAPPYESVHRSEEHLVFDLETMQVRAEYSRFGLAAPRPNQEPDDHIGLELGFLGALCVQAMDAIDSGEDTELTRLLTGVQGFLELHLLVWGAQCLGLAADGAQTLFYRGVSAMGLSALRCARAVLLP